MGDCRPYPVEHGNNALAASAVVPGKCATDFLYVAKKFLVGRKPALLRHKFLVLARLQFCGINLLNGERKHVYPVASLRLVCVEAVQKFPLFNKVAVHGGEVSDLANNVRIYVEIASVFGDLH